MHNGSGSGITDGAGIYIQGGAGDFTGPIDPETLPEIDEAQASVWVVPASDDTPQKRSHCAAHGRGYHLITDQTWRAFRLRRQ